MDLVWADSTWGAYWSAPWAWAILLLVLGLSLAVLEVFIPSGGILAFLAACSMIAAIAVGFRGGPAVGFSILMTAVFGLPTAVILALKWWPSTPMGRRMLLKAPTDKEVLPDSPRRRRLKELVGRVGVAKSEMLPSGAITVDGRTVDAVSEGMPIDAGQRVRVIEVHGRRVVVRPVDDGAPSKTDPDPLHRPIDTVGLDPFEENPPA